MAGVNHHLVAADAVQVEVHRAHAADFRRQFHALNQALALRPPPTGSSD
jgi:hypothetical protein